MQPSTDWRCKIKHNISNNNGYKLIFNIKDGELGYLNEKEFIAPLSKKEKNILNDLGLKLL